MDYTMNLKSVDTEIHFTQTLKKDDKVKYRIPCSNIIRDFLVNPFKYKKRKHNIESHKSQGISNHFKWTSFRET